MYCSRNIAGNWRKSAELINSIIIDPYLESKLWDSISLEVLLQHGRPSPNVIYHKTGIPMFSQNSNRSIPPIFRKITFSVYFSSSYFYQHTFMHHSLHVLDAPVLQWTL